VEVVVTGVGMVTPLGCEPASVLDSILQGKRATGPTPFASAVCPLVAEVDDFDAAACFPDNKTVRLMNRDAHMAVVAARRAVRDAGLASGELYSPDDVALYGATGLCGMPPAEITGLLQNSAAADGTLDQKRFGAVALRRIRPVLSFKILANMPICFVSIFENIRGPNAVYAPWEGQGAQAIAMGMRAVADGETPCALVGGCDVKTHSLAFVSLQQHGVFDSWKQHGRGTIPGEGAAFLVLEEREAAVRRGARVYAMICRHAAGSVAKRTPLPDVISSVLRRLDVPPNARAVLAGDDDQRHAQAEQAAIQSVGIEASESLRPKQHLGNTFAAAAAVQVAMAALLSARRPGAPVLANCFGHGTEQAAFLLESP
jgi:3-oxoacyl-[acyl-carrier-protein] synthase II